MTVNTIKLSPSLTYLADDLLAKLTSLSNQYPHLHFASSLGAEDMVITHLIAVHQLPIRIFTLDTGRLFQATYDLLSAIETRYPALRIDSISPQTQAIEQLHQSIGANGFYKSVTNRKACCSARKIEPLKRALAKADAWLTGLRREQSESRDALAYSQIDPLTQLPKYNPLADWTEAQVWEFINANNVPVNSLHAKGFPSIGCAPCTRAIEPGEPTRAGRWWWEIKAVQEGQVASQECGLHVAPDGSLVGSSVRSSVRSSVSSVVASSVRTTARANEPASLLVAESIATTGTPTNRGSNGASNSTHLDALENEAIHILREAIAESNNAALLFSAGKDSLVVLRLIEKAFRTKNIALQLPLQFLHVDTGHNFPEVIAFRDKTIARLGESIVIGSVEDSIRAGTVTDRGLNGSRNALQSVTLLEAIQTNGFDCLIGGARRDEEKARAKERIFSHRDAFGGWNPRRQRPELWSLYNGRVAKGEHLRVFPISNWTELDVWSYITRENIELPSIYYSHLRPCVKRNDKWLAVTEFTPALLSETITQVQVRYRTVGDVTCTCPVESAALDNVAILQETLIAKISERGATRLDDQTSDAAMENRKKEGYF